MTASDAEAVLAIYRNGLATGEASFECDVPTWQAWNATHHMFSRLVYEEAEVILGWAALAPASNRFCYRGVAELSVYVDLDRQGEGIGGKLMAEIIEDSEKNGIWTLFSSIFPENGVTHRLHLRHGFTEVGIRKRIAQQDGHWRDTLILERRSKVVGI